MKPGEVVGLALFNALLVGGGYALSKHTRHDGWLWGGIGAAVVSDAGVVLGGWGSFGGPQGGPRMTAVRPVRVEAAGLAA